MADLKTFWTDPGMPMSTDLGGTSVTSSGTDPQVDTGGTDALSTLWTNPPVPTMGGEEDPNSVSGLPLQPNRFEPAAAPPEPPTLQDRRPGTIDQA